jgi:hypothetical protein
MKHRRFVSVDKVCRRWQKRYRREGMGRMPREQQASDRASGRRTGSDDRHQHAVPRSTRPGRSLPAKGAQP